LITNYLVQVKRLTLEEPENKCTEEGVDRVISRIERSFGHMKVQMIMITVVITAPDLNSHRVEKMSH